MKLDETFISIRRRTGSELFDLALTVVRAHFRPLLILLLVGTLPWLIVDCVLAWPVMNLSIDHPKRWLFSWLMMLLVVSQAHYGTALVTQYLGEALFVGQPNWRTIAMRAFWPSGPFVMLHGLLRLTFPVLALAWLIEFESPESVGILAGFWIPACVVVALLIRAFRPFASEMLLLEKTPWLSRGENVITYRRRTRAIHTHASSELFSRFVLSVVFATPLAISLQSMFVGVDSLLNLAAGSDWTLASYYWVVSLWLAAGFMAVFRFLSYIDIRIRQDGWEIELRMRAEGQKLRLASGKEAVKRRGVEAAVRMFTGMVIMFLIGLFAATAVADNGADLARESLERQKLPWYDADADAVQPIELLERDRAESYGRGSVPEAGPPWEFDWLDWIKDLDFSFLAELRWLFWVALIGLLIVAIIWAVRNLDTRPSLVTDDHLPQRSRAESVAQLPFSLDLQSVDGDFRALAAKAYASNDYRQAIVWLFSHVLVSLDQGNLIRLAKGKTNRQYLKELRRKGQLSGYYEGVMLPFEATFFGDHELSGRQFEDCWRGLDQFESQLASLLHNGKKTKSRGGNA